MWNRNESAHGWKPESERKERQDSISKRIPPIPAAAQPDLGAATQHCGVRIIVHCGLLPRHRRDRLRVQDLALHLPPSPLRPRLGNRARDWRPSDWGFATCGFHSYRMPSARWTRSSACNAWRHRGLRSLNMPFDWCAERPLPLPGL